MIEITVLLFASFKDQLGESKLTIQLQSGSNILDLSRLLQAKGPKWQQVLSAASVKVALNQQMADFEQALSNGDEVAFFPPVTGG